MYGCELRPDMAGLASDTVSEVSTRGSSVYSDSREDLRDFAAVLGLPDVDHLCQDRFRVDRRKLEHMLLGDTPTQETAAEFFQRIMDETNTLIVWPARLKIGSKSKNDPHVRIAGRPDDVKEAKKLVMCALDVRSNRVTMKLNVSYTDHSHIIGKGGLTIKRVMEDTGCHIHFPDSNRSNPMEKSNQVSIAGDMEGVERARARVRELTPLMFSFELPIVGTLQPLPDPDSPYLLSIQEKYNVQVMFRTRPKLHATLVVVKGCEWEVAQVKEATLLLINHMCETLANTVQVQMSMEISPQHHPTVVGKNSNNLKMIMHRTATQIMFPDAGDPNIPSIKKSNVLITGIIHNVYLARQQLLGALPLLLMFDVPEESVAVDTEQVAELMQNLDVMINIRHKPKQNTMSVIIKGIERNASNIYEARNQLLGLRETTVKADIPPTYQMSDNPTLYDFNCNLSKGGLSPFNLLTINTSNGMFPVASPASMSPGISPSLMSPGMSPSMLSSGMPWGHFGLLAPAHGHHPSQALSAQQLSQLLNTPMPSQQQQHQHQQQLLLQHLVPRMQHMNFSQMSSNSSGRNSDMSDSGCGGSCSSGYQSGTSSRMSESAQSLDCRDYQRYSNNTSTVSSPAASPRLSSPIQGLPDSSKMDLLSLMSENQEGHSSTFKKPAEHQKTTSSSDYHRKKALAAKTMQMKPVPEVLRIPTSGWSGYGFSHSSPSSVLKDQLKKDRVIPEPLDSEAWKATGPDSVGSSTSSTPVFASVTDFGSVPANGGKGQDSPFSASSYLDSLPSSSLASITSSRASDLSSMLISIGMEKYIAIFKEHEIDLNVFMSLTDKDLREIGVTTFGARRTMLMSIAQHKRQTSPFRGSAAPGAERKGSSSTISNSSPTEAW